MKYFTFFPGFVVVLLFAVLLTMTKAFHLDMPLLKDIKRPLVALVIAGLMMCAFGTLAHTVSGFFNGTPVDALFIVTVLVGLLILVVSGLAIFSGKPVFGLFSENASYWVVTSLLVVKIAISTVRLIRLS